MHESSSQVANERTCTLIVISSTNFYSVPFDSGDFFFMDLNACFDQMLQHIYFGSALSVMFVLLHGVVCI